MTRVRDLLIIVGLFSVLIAFVVVGPGGAPPQDLNLPSTYSSAPNGGARALRVDARNGV